MYIHERPEWPEYRYDLGALMRDLEYANLRRGRLYGVLEAIGFDGVRSQDVDAITEELVKSSAIEGERLDLAVVRSSVARRLGVDRGGIVGSDHYVDGLVEMAMDAAKRFNEPLTAERIFNWHAALFPSGRNAYGSIAVGRWRDDAHGPMVVASQKGSREIVHFEAPHADRLPAEMGRFLDWFEATNETSLVLKAGIAHLWFETLHPMDDGNGRIGRNVMDLLLARADQQPHRPYSLASQIHRHRDEYYDTLEASQRGNLDYTRWLAWYLRMLCLSLDDAIAAVSAAMERNRFWQVHRDQPLNERQRKAIARMLMGWEGRMTNRKYARLTTCSDATATRDLADLVAKRMLRHDGAGGRSTAYELVPVAELDELTV
ncbi:MAG: Fic family protein [Fimbriimonadaceae bacterium]|nr:Fic family protein [Fimbriimonadaceae bacterium]